MKKIYIIGIGGIGISAIARYYLENGYEVYGSDKNESELTKKLENEGINIIIGEDESRINKDFSLVVYTEAVPTSQIELSKAIDLGIEVLTYPQSLANIANKNKLISISGTHGKSTTTSLVSLVLKASEENFTSVVGTILKEFDGKNFYHRGNSNSNSAIINKIENSNKDYFVIEACEYKRSFLAYESYIGIITNIDLDHLDYYKDLEDYISAFDEYINNIKSGGFVILNGNDDNCKKLIGKRSDIKYIEVFDKYFMFDGEMYKFPEINMKVPGEHVLFDAHLAYIVGHMLGMMDEKIINTLENYTGVWRRMEIIGETNNENTLISDYGHHPTEIKATLKALKDKSPARPILTIFQPHQYSRTLELLEGFKTCFYDTDKLIIPDIYESRDTEEDKAKINSKKLVEYIKHDNKEDGNGLDNTFELINKWDTENNFGIILLLGAGNIDDLRHSIITK